MTKLRSIRAEVLMAALVTFSNFVLLSPAACATESNAKVPSQESLKEGAVAAASTLFAEYKKRDQACDPKLVELYADNARIESDVERKDTPVQKERYDRAKFCALINKTFADPAAAKISAGTVYGSPTITPELLDKNLVKVEFGAFQGETAMKVRWLLRRNKDGIWLIEDEHTVTYRKNKDL